MAEISARTGIALQDLDPDERLSRYGLDSARATALIADLGAHLGRRLSPTLFWHYPTVDALAAHVSADDSDTAAGDREAHATQLEPVAIIGMGCRFPGAPNPEAFWDLLRDGKDAMGDVPSDRWDADAYFSSDPQAPGKMITRRAGFIDGVDQFDAQFFSLSPREAAEVDPQQRLALEVCWEALEDAGVPADRLRGSRTGVFIGAIWHDYADLHRGAGASITAHTGLGQALDIIANRVSYVLGLQGPSLAVDTACSSSLVAIHLACQSLRSGESTLALAGGVSLMLSPDTMVALSKFGGLSPDGRSMAFDARANGFARGEGAGIVVLKRLSAALADGDPVYCVIRGSAVNNDGFSNGLSAPNPAAQESVLREAYRNAGVAPSQVHYVEAHGTGTALGDPIEARALGTVLGVGRAPDRPLSVGSVKTNIGHLEGASGIAGVIKTVLAMRHRTIPASLHFETPNPHIPFEELRVSVQKATGPWPGEGAPLAGVSAFGWGGTNCHLVLEDAFAAQAIPPGAGFQPPGKIAFVCSPYGPQWPGMGCELLATEPAFRAKLEACDRTLQPLTGWSVIEELTAFQTGGRWNDVSVVQPLLFACQVALAAQWRAWGIVPDAIVGHSLGEIAAAHIAGALNLEDAALVIYHYSRLQAQQAGGGMAIVGLGAEELAADLARFSGRIVVAAHNSPRTTVLSGCPVSLKTLLADLKERAVFCSPIDIDVAAHSPDIDAIMDELRQKLAGIAPQPPSIPMISTLTGEPVGDALLDGAYWARNLRHPVLLAQAMDWLLARDHRIFVELAPHQVMGHALEQSIAAAGVAAAVLPSCRRDEGERKTMLATLAVLPARNGLVETDRPEHVLALSAKTVEALRAWARQYAAVVAEPSLADICFSANTGRAQFSQRLVVRAGSAAQMRERLLAFAAGKSVDGVCSGDARRGVSLEQESGLGEQWVQGAKVDWREFHRGDARRRVPVPSYPFQRTRCWFTPGEAAPPAGSNPLLGRRVRSALEPIQFEAELSPARPGYLGEHRVNGTALLPTAAYLEMALAAAQQGEREIEAMTLREPLWFTGEQARVVNMILDGNRFRVFSQGAGDGPWTLHVDGKLRTHSQEAAGLVSLDEVRERCREAVDIAGWYREFDRAGLHYGSAFRKVERLWRGEGEALGVIAAGEAVLMLDAALQVLFAALPAERSGVYLPISLERFHLANQRIDRVWSHATIRPGSDSAFTADVRLFDEAGGLIGEAVGFHLRRTTSAAWAEWLYRVEWQPAATPQAGPYRELAPRLDSLAGAYAFDALRQLGATLQPGEAIDEASLAAQLGIVPAHRRLLGPMLRMAASSSRADAPALAAAIRSEFPDSLAELTLLERCGERLTGVLTGRCDALEVLFPNGSLAAAEAFYADSAFSREMNARVRDAVASSIAASSGRKLRVLEIGAGTGSATSVILPVLPAGRTEYVFTDVSPIFLAHGREKFRAYPYVKYQLLDIEREAAADEGFDLVIAANVLHATADLRQSLAHIARLMKPGASLVLLEVTRRDPWVDLVFGLTEGWWKFADHDLRADHALLPADQWVRLLGETGFIEPSATDTGDSGQAVLTAHKSGARTERRPWWIVGEADGLAREVTALLEARGERCVASADAESSVEGVIHLSALECSLAASAATLEADEERTCRSVVRILQEQAKSSQPNRRGIWVVTRGAQGSAPSIAQAAVWGVGRVAANEHPELWGGLIDLDPEDSAHDAGRIVEEVMRARGEDQIAYRGGQRTVARLERVDARPGRKVLRFREDACYLITGGLGGLGLAMVPWMVERGARHIALAGRGAASPEARRLLDGIDPAARVSLHRADVTRAQDVESLLAAIAQEHPPLAGVFHAAGVLHDAALLQQDWTRFRQVTAPKIQGAWNLHTLTAGLPLEYFVLFSSQTALLGSAGQANHAAANAFLDALAHRRRAAGLPAISINWGAWERIGAAMQANLGSYFAAHGMGYIEPREALAAFEHLLLEAPVQCAVMNIDWARFAEATAAGRSPMFRGLSRPALRTESVKQAAATTGWLHRGNAVERRQDVLAHVRELAGRVLRLDDVDPEQALLELGLDSLMAIELKNYIEAQLGVTVPVVKILEGASARQLAECLMEQVQVDSLLDSVHAAMPAQNTETEWDVLRL